MPMLTRLELLAILKLYPDMLDKLNGTLTPIEIHVLKERFQIFKEKTWKEVGKTIGEEGITGERARQIADGAIRKLFKGTARQIILDTTDLKISIRK